MPHHNTHHISRGLPILGNLTAHGGTAPNGIPIGKTLRIFSALIFSPWLPAHMRALPVVEVGTNDGTDFAIPVARHAAGRLYSFEPGVAAYRSFTANLDKARILWTDATRPNNFRRMPPGSVLACHAAVSNVSTTLNFTESNDNTHNFANTLTPRGLPHYVKSTRLVEVSVVKLDDVLANEIHGVLMIKLDVQGQEYHVLKGAESYILRHRVPVLLLEFTPKLLIAAGVAPQDLLSLLYDTFSYQCFDLSPPAPTKFGRDAVSFTFTEFLANYPPTGNNFGRWTDLLCVDFSKL